MNNYKKILPTFVTLDKLGSKIQVAVRHSAKAKRIAIKIKYKKTELVLPNKDIKNAYAFLLTKESWIRKKLALVSKQIVVDPNTLPLFGKYYSLQYIDAKDTKVQVHENVIQIHSSLTLRKTIIFTQNYQLTHSCHICRY